MWPSILPLSTPIARSSELENWVRNRNSPKKDFVLRSPRDVAPTSRSWRHLGSAFYLGSPDTELRRAFAHPSVPQIAHPGGVTSKSTSLACGELRERAAAD